MMDALLEETVKAFNALPRDWCAVMIEGERPCAGEPSRSRRGLFGSTTPPSKRRPITVSEVRSPDRDRTLARARQVVMFLARERGGISTTVIGRILGGRDHTTVLHGERRIRALMVVSPELAALVGTVRAAVAVRSEKTVAPCPIFLEPAEQTQVAA